MFSRLLRRGRDVSPRDPAPGASSGVDAVAAALEDVDLGPPPVLLPAAIFREVLYDPAEFSPAWLRPRAATQPDRETPPAPAVLQPAVGTGPTVDEASDLAPSTERTSARRTRRTKSTSQTAAAAVDEHAAAAVADAGAGTVPEVMPSTGPATVSRTRRSKVAKAAGSPTTSPTRGRRRARAGNDVREG